VGTTARRRTYPEDVSGDDVIDSLARAVAASPDDAALRVHLAELLIAAGRRSEVVPHAAWLLQQDPQSAVGRTLMYQALTGDDGAPSSTGHVDDLHDPAPQPPRPTGFDWDRAEDDLGDLVPPMFADSTASRSEVSAFDVESAGITLADVGGMTEVKKRLNAAFLAPMRNEKLRTMYRKSLRGGLLL
jgi:hypothetical protein